MIGEHAADDFQIQVHRRRLECLPRPAPRIALHAEKGFALAEAESDLIALREPGFDGMIATPHCRSGWGLNRRP